MTTCPYVCNNKTSYGYCCSTVCINPLYNQRTINGGLTADYVQVVRCKDCKYSDECHKTVQYTHRENRTTMMHGFMTVEYCSRGERRT